MPYLPQSPCRSRFSGCADEPIHSALYNFAWYEPCRPKEDAFAVAEFSPQSYLPSDLDLFFNYSASAPQGTRPVLRSIDGGTVQTSQTGFDYNGESDLDLQYGMGLLYPQPVSLYQVGPQVGPEAGYGSFNTL